MKSAFLQFSVCLIALVISPALAENPVNVTVDNNSPQVVKKQAQTLNNILAETYTHNPRLRAARAELRAIRERLPQARAGWLPSITANLSAENSDRAGWLPSITANLSAENSDIDSDPAINTDGSNTSKNLSLSIDQPLYRGGRTIAETKAALNIIRSQAASVVAQEQAILLDAATAYLNVVRDRALLELAINNKNLINKQYEATQQRFEVGKTTKTDVEQAKARLANTQAQIITSEGNLRNSEADYFNVTGLVATDLDFPVDLFDTPETLDIALDIASKRNPNIVAAQSAQAAAEDDVDGIFAELLPSVSLEASSSRAYDPVYSIDDQDNNTIGIRASIPLFQAGSVRSRVRQAKHIANQRYMDILDIKRATVQSVTRNFQNLNTARAEIAARSAQAEASRIARDGVNAELRYGSRTVLDALDADQELLDAEVALVTAKTNKIIAEFSLLSVLGLITPDHIGFEAALLDDELTNQDFLSDIFNMDVDRLR